MTLHFRPLPDDYPEFVYGRCDASGVIIGGKFHPLKAGAARIVATLYANPGKWFSRRELAKIGGVAIPTMETSYLTLVRSVLIQKLGMQLFNQASLGIMARKR